MKKLRIESDHLGMRQQTRCDEREHGIAGRQQDLRLGLERLRLKTMLERRASLLPGDFDVPFACRIQRFGIPRSVSVSSIAPCVRYPREPGQ